MQTRFARASRAVHFLPLPYFLSAEPIASIFHSSRSSAERDHCLAGNYFNFLNTVSLILVQNFHQQFILISESYPYFSRPHACGYYFALN